MNEYKGIPYARMHAHGYRCEWPTANPCIRLQHTDGCYGEALVNKPNNTVHNFNSHHSTWNPERHKLMSQ